MVTKIVSATAIHSLKEALCCIYWYKNDLRSFLQNCLSNKTVIANANWQGYKRQIVSDVVDTLCADQDRNIGDIQRLLHEVAKMDNFRHLENVEDGKKKIIRARQAVADLRRIVNIHDNVVDEEGKIEERRKKQAEKLSNNSAVQEKLEDIKARYMSLVTSSSPNKRGFELEKILYDLFDLFDLDPKASFKNTGEQLDGAFTLEGTDYLFEAKWEKDPISIQALDGFAGKVRRKLDNTLGLFLSINDFSQDAIIAHSVGRPVVILMTGADLMAVLEGRTDFVTLLLRKRRHASLTGNILYKIHEMI
jgi:hypothetical protein